MTDPRGQAAGSESLNGMEDCMDNILRLKLAMLTALVDFLRAHPLGEGAVATVVARFVEKVARLQALIAQQQDGASGRKAQTGRYQELRQQITRVPLYHLAGLAPALAAEAPELAALLKTTVSSKSGPLFLATAHSVLQAVETHQELLLAQGMLPATPTELKTLLAEYEQAVSDAHAGRRAHTGARSEMQGLIRELMQMVRHLDGTVAFHFRGQPELLGAWKSARNVAWPVETPDAPAARPALPAPRPPVPTE
ncbi:MAG: hypothetical protein IPO73_04185 [Gemmatimonadetes bacterium]|nr:hypothetical protein [Gemmatimonadota bacterium]